MKIRSSMLSACILVLCITSGLMLFSSAAQWGTDSASSGALVRIPSFSANMLTRFSLFPGSRKPVPFAVVIENHEDSRKYHAGLSEALMIQEYLVEGFISRFIALFDARSLPREIGPARSLRPYFLDGIAPWTRAVFHAGGSPEALERVTEGGEFFARNLLYLDDENKEHGSLRKEGVPAPHDLFLRKRALKSFLREAPESFMRSVDWPPFAVGIQEGGDSAVKMRVNFFNALHTVYFEYLPLAQKYKRTNGATVSEARPANVVVLEIPIDEVGAYGRLFMTTEGKGNALVFHSGKVWEGTWSRSSIEEPFALHDSAGNPILLNRGQVWLMVLPTLQRVTWTEGEQ